MLVKERVGVTDTHLSRNALSVAWPPHQIDRDAPASLSGREVRLAAKLTGLYLPSHIAANGFHGDHVFKPHANIHR